MFIPSFAAHLLLTYTDFGPSPDTIAKGKEVIVLSEKYKDDDGTTIFIATVLSTNDANGTVKVKYDDGDEETVPTANVRVRLSALPTSMGKLVPVPLRRSDEANEDEINEAEANEDGLFTEEEANSIKRRCCEILEAEARAKGASAPSEKVQKLIDNKFGEAIKLRDQDEPVIPMDQIIDDPDIQMMLDWYDVVVLNGNLGATRKETLMVSLFSFLLL